MCLSMPINQEVQQNMMKLYDDMCLMSSLKEEGILDNLIQRYQQDQIFTCIGPTLISLNPYKLIPQLFNQELVDSLAKDILTGDIPKQPHIFVVAGRAFQGMVSKIEKQSVIISGESGAGKTEATKYCMQMLTQLSHSEGLKHPIETKILACNPILQAFGNSKTLRNENSSRFGKYVQIYFGPDHTIKGSNIKSYLLEKSRVTNIAPNERSFHIFYSLCATGLAGVRKPSQYRFLSQSECYQAHGINQRQSFSKVKAAMAELGFLEEQQQKIWILLVAILELGNLQFDDSERQQKQSLPCKIKNIQNVEQISQKLGIPSQQLSQMLLYTKILIPRQQVIKKAMDKNDCNANLNTLCKSIYNSIFQWILSKIQTVLNPPIQMQDFYKTYRSSLKVNMQQPPPPARFQINILDIFGFENFKENSLEQLCINYTNQKLLDLYNRCVFDNQITILREDGLQGQIDHIQPPSNDASVRLLDDIFRTIKDKTRIKQCKDQDIVWEFKTNRANSQHIRTITYDKFDEKLFVVQHSPCQVAYNVTNFKLKNQDRLTPQIQNLVISLFQQARKVQSGRTLLQKFTNQINSLTDQLQTATNHYVRCIKPNESKTNSTDRQFIQRQVKYMGIFETIEIRKKIFPFRRFYEEMAYLFQPIFPSTKGKAPRMAIDIILNEIKAKPDQYLLGTHRIYMNQHIEEQLSKLLMEYDKVRLQSSNKIKRFYRKAKFRQHFKECVKMVIERIATFKKWGKRVQKLMFCCFQEISETAKHKQILDQKSILEKELGQQIDRIIQIEKSQVERSNIILQESQEQTPFKSICRIISSNQFMKGQDNSIHQKQILNQVQKLQQEIMNKDVQIIDEVNSAKELKNQQIQMQQMIKKSKEKEVQMQKRFEETQRILAEKSLAVTQLEQNLKIKQEENKYLSEQLQMKSKECGEISDKFKQTQEKLQKIQSSPQFKMQNKIQKISQAHGQTGQPPVKNWMAVQAELKALQHKSAKCEQLQTVNRQSSSKAKELESMVISLQDIVNQHKAKNEQFQNTIEELHQKIYKKCQDYEDLLHKYHVEQKRNQEEGNSERLKTIAKETIDKLRTTIGSMETERKGLYVKIQQLKDQNQQHKRLVENFKNNVQSSRLSSRVSSEFGSEVEKSQQKQVSQQELFSLIHAYKFGKSKDSLLTLKQKINYILP